MSRTASFDVFDTVVTRTFAHPRDLFVHLGARLRQQGLHRLDPLAFARERWAAELAARKRSAHVEVLIDEIYVVLAERLQWDAAVAAQARDLELELEARHLRGVPLMRAPLAAARAASTRVLFLSDMYLPAAVLRPWLAREGIIEDSDLLLISGEGRANKSSGRLFAVAREQAGADYADWHHAGDHPYADVAKPRELGLTATHLTHAHLTPREVQARGSTGEFAPVWRSLLAGAMRLARLERILPTAREATLWETGADVTGPLFYGFVRWVLHEAQRRGIRRLYFLARDGQIFWKVAQAIQSAEAIDVECRYLHASRLVFAGPAELASPQTLRWLTAPTGHFHSLRQALLQVGLDEAWARANLPPEFRDRDCDANLPAADREAFADWLLAPHRRAAIQAGLARRAGDARAYLESQGVRAGEPIALVDAGWLGSIHRNLERILGTDAAPAPLVGFYLGLLPPQSPRPVGELLGYTNRFSPLPLVREESHKVLLELMAQSDHGQVTGFRLEHGEWHPILNASGPVNLDEVRLFHAALLAFVRRANETAAEAAAPEADFARVVIGLYRDFHDHPRGDEARLFGFLPHADQLYEQKYATLCADFTLGGLLAALKDYRLRPPHWWIGGQAALNHGALLRGFRDLKRRWWQLRQRAE